MNEYIGAHNEYKMKGVYNHYALLCKYIKHASSMLELYLTACTQVANTEVSQQLLEGKWSEANQYKGMKTQTFSLHLV